VLFNATEAGSPFVKIYFLNDNYTPSLGGSTGQKGSNWITYVIVFTIVAVIGGTLGWFFYHRSQKRKMMRRGESLLS